jgi:hypothetical protein
MMPKVPARQHRNGYTEKKDKQVMVGEEYVV